jgi:uncharacterized membrane protein (UPF0127 family)
VHLRVHRLRNEAFENPVTKSRFADMFRGIWSRRDAGAEVRIRLINVTRQVEIADCIEIADKGKRRRKGLLGRSGLAIGEGLWIVPCEAVHTFGMKFPIDLVYLDRTNRVVKTRSHVGPGRLSACLSARSVVELPSGTVQGKVIQRGDILELMRVPACRS